MPRRVGTDRPLHRAGDRRAEIEAGGGETLAISLGLGEAREHLFLAADFVVQQHAVDEAQAGVDLGADLRAGVLERLQRAGGHALARAFISRGSRLSVKS